MSWRRRVAAAAKIYQERILSANASIPDDYVREVGAEERTWQARHTPRVTGEATVNSPVREPLALSVVVVLLQCEP